MLTIRKQPQAKYLETKTFCLNQIEFDLVNNKNLDSEIIVFTEEGDMAHTIAKKQYKLLNFTLKNGGEYYITDFSQILARKKQSSRKRN